MPEKILGTPEGRAGVWLIDAATAEAIVTALPQEYVHNLLGHGATYIGADWTKDSVAEFLRRDDLKLAMLFPPNITIKHQLVALSDTKRWAFDIGEIDESAMQPKENAHAEA